MAMKTNRRNAIRRNATITDSVRCEERARGAVFLDKDGTLLVDVPYNVVPERMQFAPTVMLGLRLLAQFDLPLIVVSNQPGVALGFIREQQLKTVGRQLHDMFRSVNAALTAFRYCPHLPDNSGKPACGCRKPKPGLLRAAAAEFNIDLGRSWMVGDILNDVEAGVRAGCRTILIDNDHETEWQMGKFRKPTHVVSHFNAAARIIAESISVRNG